MKASATTLTGALFLAGSMLTTLPASAQERVDMRSSLAGQRGQAYRQDDRGYRPEARSYDAPAPVYSAPPPVSAHGRYGMRYSGYDTAPGYGGYPRDAGYGDDRSQPRLVGRAPDGYDRGGDYQSYGGGPLREDRRGGYRDGYADQGGGDPQYANGGDDGGYGGDENGGGYDRRRDRRDAYYGSDAGYTDEPYGYRGGRGYAGPYGYGYDRRENEAVHYHFDDHVDHFSGFVAPPPHDSREARELRDYCGCDDESY